MTALCALFALSLSLVLPQPTSAQTHTVQPRCAMCSHCAEVQCCTGSPQHNDAATVVPERIAMVFPATASTQVEVVATANTAAQPPAATVTPPRSPFILRL
jgi:hypothetical protein